MIFLQFSVCVSLSLYLFQARNELITFPSSSHCHETANDPRSCSSSTRSAAEESTNEKNGTCLEQKQPLLLEIEEIESTEEICSRHMEFVEQTKELRKRRTEIRRQYKEIQRQQVQIQRQQEEIHRYQAEIQRQQAEIERQQAENQKQRDCWMDELKIRDHKERSNREREKQADRQYKFNLEQIQFQADKLRCKLQDHDKQRPVDVQEEVKSAQQVFILISILYRYVLYLSFAHFES